MIDQDLRIHNTLTRQKEVFTPINSEDVSLYVCGPTVYNYVHIGNARPMVIFDVLFKLLKTRFPKVTYVRNITDVDDKINKAAMENNESIATLSQRYADFFRNDMQALGVEPPTIEPLATEHIDEMIAMIELLIDKKLAYCAEGHVLFDVSQYPDYGKLSNRSPDQMIAGARVEVAPYKKTPADFVLWKPSEDSLPGWASPWGRGRPGWHIECSAMIRKHLGASIDIHGGGQDLIFPHHENEMAQGCGCDSESKYANYWMHNGYLTTSGEKMSKSLGNFLTVHNLLETHPGESLRYALLSAYYRSPLEWNDDTPAQATASLDRLYNAIRDYDNTSDNTSDNTIDSSKANTFNHKVQTQLAAIETALLDDLNTPLALSALHQIANQCFKEGDAAQKRQYQQALIQGGQMMGLLNQSGDSWFTDRKPSTELSLTPDEIEAEIEKRNQARQEKQFAEADRIRDYLQEHGIELEDSPKGTQWQRI